MNADIRKLSKIENLISVEDRKLGFQIQIRSLVLRSSLSLLREYATKPLAPTICILDKKC